MAAGDFRHALDGPFYWGTAGSQASTRSYNVTNAQMVGNSQTEEVVLRGETYEHSEVISLQCSITFTAFDIEGDGLVAALETAFHAKSLVALHPTTANSGKGLDADYVITQFTRDESGLNKFNVEAKPNKTNRSPTWQVSSV